MNPGLICIQSYFYVINYKLAFPIEEKINTSVDNYLNSIQYFLKVLSFICLHKIIWHLLHVPGMRLDWKVNPSNEWLRNLIFIQ